MIFSIFKRDNTKYNLPTTDLHSHLLPAIDDGSQSLEETKQLIAKLIDLGYKKAITTPHIYYGMFPNTEERIRETYNSVLPEIKKEFPNFKLEFAAEYFLEDVLLERAKTEGTAKLLTFGKNKKYLLFEMSYQIPSILLRDFVSILHKNNIIPVLAHPSRYMYSWDNPKILDEWKTMGIKFQENINCFSHYYGKEVKKTATFLAKKGYISFLGSDTHNLRHLESIEKIKSKQKILQLIFDNNEILNDSEL